MDATLATTYILIHSFLRKHSHTKAALAVKKAAKDIVILKDDVEIEEPHLDTIIQEWKAAQPVGNRVSSSDSSSGSDSEDSSDSSSSDSSDSSDDSSDSGDTSTPEIPILRKGEVSKPGKPYGQVKTKVEQKTASSSDESSSDSSDSDDSGSESSDSDTNTIKPDQKLIKTKTKAKAECQSSQTLTSGNSSSSSAASDRKGEETSDTSDSSDSGDDVVVTPGPAEKAILTSTDKAEFRATKQKKSKRGSSSSSTSNSSSSDSELSIIKDKPDAVNSNKQYSTRTGGSATPAPATKKRRTNEDGAAVVTATTETVEPNSGPQFSGRIKANGKPARKSNVPFKRVDPEKVDQQSLLQDNGYMAKAAPTNDYGARAHQDLIVTRGAGFRKEKNKKKRGSYKGGNISLESHSFKFTY